MGPEGTRRWRMLVAYDGRGFRGFAEQQGVPTVAGSLGRALARAARLADPPQLTCAGRTDAGVHARGQVVHADLPHPLPAVRRHGAERPFDGEDLAAGVNRQTAPQIVVRRAGPAPAGWDARHSAVSRRYRYLIWNAPVPDPLLSPTSWHVADPLDRRLLEAAADAVVGEHDFRAFCRRPPGTPADQPIVRRVRDTRWEELRVDGAAPGRLLSFEIEADSFCHQMVRSVVALLVESGRGRENVAGTTARLRAAERGPSPSPAPPEGLCLMAVRYPPEDGWPEGWSGDGADR